MSVVDSTRIAIDHRAYFLRGAPQQEVLIAASSECRFSVVRGSAVTQRTFPRAHRLVDLCAHPTLPLLAGLDWESGNLIVCDFDGSFVYERKPERRRSIESYSPGAGFIACLFDEDGEHLWLAEPMSNDSIRIDHCRVADWSVRRATMAEDPFGDSYCAFGTTAQANLLSFYLGAGQDGQQVCWLTRSDDANLVCRAEGRLRDTTPPVFAPHSAEFLVVEDGLLRKFSFPSCREEGCCALPDEGECFGYEIDYVDDTYALVDSGASRLYLVDTSVMRVVEEVIVAGHEPKPTEELYPALTGDTSLSTDLSYFNRIGSQFVFVSRRNRGSTALEDWQDDLLIVELRALTQAL